MVGGHGAVLCIFSYILFWLLFDRLPALICWQALLGFDSRFLCDVSFLFFPKSTATHRNHMKCVCASFILVWVVQMVHTKKPRLTSKQNEAHIYVGTVQGPSHRWWCPSSLVSIGGGLASPTVTLIFTEEIIISLGRCLQPTKTFSHFFPFCFVSSCVGYVPASNDLGIFRFVWRC